MGNCLNDRLYDSRTNQTFQILAVADDHRDDGRICHLLLRPQELFIRHPGPHGRVRHLQNDVRRHHRRRESDLRHLEAGQRLPRRLDQRPLAHGDGSGGERRSEPAVRRRCDRLCMVCGRRLRRALHLCAGGVLHGAADRQQHLPGVRISAVQPAHHPLGAAPRVGHEDVDLEYVALDRRLHRGAAVRLHHGPHGCRPQRRSPRWWPASRPIWAKVPVPNA